MSTRTPTSGAVRARTNGTPVKTPSVALVQLRKRAAEVKAVVLFSIDDEEFTMSETVELGDAIKWASHLNVIRDEDLKGVQLLRFLCGDKAVDALLNDATMTDGEWKNLIKVMTEHAFGPKEREDESGN